MAHEHRRRRQLAVVVGALAGVGQGGVGCMDPHELFSGRALASGSDDVRVARERQLPVRGLDLLATGPGGDAKDVVERGGVGDGSGNGSVGGARALGRGGVGGGYPRGAEGGGGPGGEGGGDGVGRRGEAESEKLGRGEGGRGHDEERN